MGHGRNGEDNQAPPAKRRRSSNPLEETLLPADEDAAINEHSPAANAGTNGLDAENADSESPERAASAPIATPRKRGRPPKQTPTKSPATPSTTAAAIDRRAFLTPLKAAGPNASTPGRNAADRSARRKTARKLLEHATGDGGDAEAENEDLARAIFGDTDDEEEDDDDDDDDDEIDDGTEASFGDGLSDAADGLLPDEAGTAASAPEKKKKKQQRTRKRAKSPTPPRDLPPHEVYFLHNKPGRPKTSDNTLAGLRLLSHDEYFDVLGRRGALTQRHAKDVEYLEALHAESFPQWALELSQGFSLCLYGFGSKRTLLGNFAAHLYNLLPDSPIVVVNGYTPTTNAREILSCIAGAVFQSTTTTTTAAAAAATTTADKKKAAVSSTQPLAMVQSILAHLSSSMPPLSLTVIVHSIDAAALRRASAAQSALASLAAHPSVHMVCSADTPDFPLLWDVGLRSAFDFVFHDCTTFAPMGVELDVVDEVHELLGRRARRVHGREGVAFVLRSLPENARNLFRLLVGEVLVVMDEDAAAAAGGGEEGHAGVEYRMMYNKAVEEFVCSSEMAFRTLLKEFHDHQIITSRKDALGTELLSLPFGREELEAILEDLTA